MFKLNQENRPLHIRISLLMLLDAVFVIAASFLALVSRLEINFDWYYWEQYLPIMGWDILICIGIFYAFRLYHSLWQFASMVEFRKIITAIICCFFVRYLLFRFIMQILLPRSWYFLDSLILMALVGGARFAYRNVRSLRNRYLFKMSHGDISHIMIVGGGEAGNVLLREILLSQFIDKKVECFIDDDPQKVGRYMNGVPIVGTRHDIIEMVKKYHITEIYIAIPSASRKQRSEIVEICNQTGCKLKILPGIYQLINGEVSIAKLRDVEIEDLLGREPIKVNLEQIARYVCNKTILITGGGGTIGSELSRQVAANHPKRLIIVDIYENNAYDIQQELKQKYPDLDLVVRIASIRDGHKIDCLFDEFRPEVVYHAAAHKHVPLMEDSPNEAIKNNVFGTLNVVRAADKYHVKRFVQISTDKAVNPTNIMGATKRLCEMIIQAYDHRSETEFVAVRFGNVLGSNGSVIPLFKKQIAAGGPVTVTHKDIIRYFMTISEAVSLVIQAGIYAKGGEIFILDMGKPMKIDDLARNLIKLSGYTPDVDIKIEYTGLRPGEKLYEELLMSEEGLKKTENDSIFIGHPLEFDEEAFLDQLDALKQLAYQENGDIKEKVQELVPTYHPYHETKTA